MTEQRSATKNNSLIGISRLLIATFILAAISNSANAAERPNIVFILADDLGYGDVKCFGGDQCKIATPHFDRLAADGMRFTDAHANASVCVPTRIAIMTGRYPWRFDGGERGGPWGFLGPRFTTEQHTLGKMMKSAGYRTGYIGKWHLGTKMATYDGKLQGLENVDFTKPLIAGPVQHGFDDSFILPGSLDMYPYVFAENNHWVGNVDSLKGWSAFNRIGPAADDFQDTKVLDTFSRKAEQFIADSSSDGAPFFLYFALTAPHTPTSPSSSFLNKSQIGIYGDFVMEVDHCVGRILDALDQHGFSDDTLVIATSDHGPAPYAGRIAEATYGQLQKLQIKGHYSTGPFRGYKFSVYEGGLRVPFIARWPGRVPKHTTCDELVGLPDMMATFADAAGIKLDDDQGPDSFSLLPLLNDPHSGPIRETMIMEGTHAMVIRSGDRKLAMCPGSGSQGRWGNKPPSTDAWQTALDSYGRRPKDNGEIAKAPFVQLFLLDDDPGETSNVAAKHVAIVNELSATLQNQIDAGRTRPGDPLQNDRKVSATRAPGFVWKQPPGPDPAIKIVETDDAILATFKGKPVLRYNKSIQKSPQGISSDFDRSGYIHPIYTPRGIEVTGDFPADHAHQHALFNAWTNTTFEGRTVDFWNQAKKLGRVSHKGVRSIGKDEFTVELLHEDLTAPNGPKPVLTETWRVNVVGLVSDSFVFDITSVQTCVADSPLRMNQYRYGGMGIRGNNQWFSDEGAAALKSYEKSLLKKDRLTFPAFDVVKHRFTTSDGKRRFAGNHSRPTWVDMSGIIDEQIAGISIIGHRQNFRFPQPVRLHPTKPYFCFAPMVIGDFEIKSGDEFVSRFRYVVHDGDLNRERVQQLSARFK